MAAFGLNPVVLVWSVGGAHNDLLMLLALLAGVALALRARPMTAGALLVSAAAIKASAGVAIPFLLAGGDRRGRLVAGLAAGAAAVAAVILTAFPDHAQGMVRALERQQSLVGIASVPSALAHALGLAAVTRPELLVLHVLLAVSLAGLLAWVVRGGDAVAATGWAFLGVVVASTWLLPWYLVWPLGVRRRGRRPAAADRLERGGPPLRDRARSGELSRRRRTSGRPRTLQPPEMPLRLALCALVVLVVTPAGVAPGTRAWPGALVSPLIGTQDRGNTFPGAAVPFGMVQLSPDDGGQAGYDFDNTRIDGFSHTHLSGVGCRALGEVPVMPTTGAVDSARPSRFGSHFDHHSEVARPGFYAVVLRKYGVRAELTATRRTGWHRYTFPPTSRANVLFDVGRAVGRVFGSKVELVGDRALKGWVQTGGFCGARDRHKVFFTARFDRPFRAFGTWTGERLAPGGHVGGGGAWVTFDARSDRDVELQVGLSYTGISGARRNLAAEAGGRTFDAVAAAAARSWTSMLGRASVEGGPAGRRVVFATALYHALLHPNVIGDVDGAYPGADGRVRIARDHVPMGNLSLWDTFRTQNALLELLAPDVARDVALSGLAAARDGGWLPRWALVTSETNVMTGDPVTPFLVEDWSAGLLASHEEEAYRALRRNAFGEPPPGSVAKGRTGNRPYATRGYIPTGLPCPVDCRRPASATLEYATADASLALMARALGHRADAAALGRRGQSFRALWDRRIGTFRPRGRDGRWMTPYDPTRGGGQFHEGGAFQYQWLVPQDPAGLVALMGGRRSAAQRLDAFFALPALLHDPARTARRTWVDRPYDYYRARTYNPNNEPDLHAPFLYAWAGQPWKTATVLRAAWTLFTTGPEGVTGNDDLGTMSAWYVLTSLGLYPTTSGGGFLALATPQFPHAVVRLGAIGDRQGGTLTIDAPGTTDARRYPAAVTLDGRPVRRTWLPRAAVAHGGRLAFDVTARPTRWGTGAGAAPPSIDARP